MLCWLCHLVVDTTPCQVLRYRLRVGEASKYTTLGTASCTLFMTIMGYGPWLMVDGPRRDATRVRTSISADKGYPSRATDRHVAARAYMDVHMQPIPGPPFGCNVGTAKNPPSARCGRVAIPGCLRSACATTIASAD